MELDELKNTWTALDERLKQSESLNARIVKEMLETKSSKALGKILGYEIFGAVVLLAVAPLIIYVNDDRFHIKEKTFVSVFLACLFFICVLGFVWQAIKIYNLMKIDFSAVVSDNIRIVNKYNLWIKREKLSMWISTPILVVCCTYFFAQLNVNLFSWVFLTCVFILTTLFTYYQYKKIYGKNINSILKSLDELKELEE